MDDPTLESIRQACLRVLTSDEIRQLESDALRQAVNELFPELVRACRARRKAAGPRSDKVLVAEP